MFVANYDIFIQYVSVQYWKENVVTTCAQLCYYRMPLKYNSVCIDNDTTSTTTHLLIKILLFYWFGSFQAFELPPLFMLFCPILIKFQYGVHLSNVYLIFHQLKFHILSTFQGIAYLRVQYFCRIIQVFSICHFAPVKHQWSTSSQ